VNALHRQFDQPASDLFDEFADSCTITRAGAGPIPARCIDGKSLAQLGEYGHVVGHVDSLSFLKAEWAPKRGDVVVLENGCEKTVESIESDDGLIVECIVNA